MDSGYERREMKQYVNGGRRPPLKKEGEGGRLIMTDWIKPESREFNEGFRRARAPRRV